MHAVTRHVRQALREMADPARAPAMARNLKNIQPLLGVNAPAVNALAKATARRFPQRAFEPFEQITRELWGGTWREERYAALRMAEAWREVQVPRALPLYLWMIQTGAWWDLVDAIAARLVGGLARRHPELKPRVCGLIDSDDLWLRRTALLFQLKYKGETDAAALSEMILKRAHEREFFIRKAIGWALREYGKTDPGFVRDFLKTHGERLSPLSRKEAGRRLES